MASITLGPYHVGEIPPTLTVTFKDSAGAAISLTGYTAEFAYRPYGGAWVTRIGSGAGATIDADQVNNKGQAHYVWVAADFATAGDFEGEMWVGNTGGAQRFDSQRFAWQVKPAVVPVPTI